MVIQDEINTAERDARSAQETLISVLNSHQSFVFEAGAGSGKTHSLIEALNYILKCRTQFLPYPYQKIACITYTNVARDEIIERTNHSEQVTTATIHNFLWQLMQPFQVNLRKFVHELEWLKRKIIENPEIVPTINSLRISYSTGIHYINDYEISLDHNDIPKLGALFLKNSRFQRILADKFPVIFIDEYQDTHQQFANALLLLLTPRSGMPAAILGFFGDQWQQIYSDSVGAVTHESLMRIKKGSNFRSSRAVISFLNYLRPDLPQVPRADAPTGRVDIYHTNLWQGLRQTGQFKGQIPENLLEACITLVRSKAFLSSPRVLLLTNRSIAHKSGFGNLFQAFTDIGHRDSLLKAEDPVIDYLVHVLVPAIQAYKDRRYGDLQRLFSPSQPMLQSSKSKLEKVDFFNVLVDYADSRTIADVASLICASPQIPFPEALSSICCADASIGSATKNYQPLGDVRFAELLAFASHLRRSTPFCTQHSTKGAEFDDVLLVLSAGWNAYNFHSLISQYQTILHQPSNASPQSLKSRNLFYVSASRARENLALLFACSLDDVALAQLEEWVGPEHLHAINFSEDDKPYL